YSPDLAMKFYDLQKQSASVASSDAGLLAMSVAATKIGGSSAQSNTHTFASLQDRMSSDQVKAVSSVINVVLSDYSAEEVIRHAERVAGIGSRLLLLREWCRNNSRRENAVLVTSYGLRKL